MTREKLHNMINGSRQKSIYEETYIVYYIVSKPQFFFFKVYLLIKEKKFFRLCFTIFPFNNEGFYWHSMFKHVWTCLKEGNEKNVSNWFWFSGSFGTTLYYFSLVWRGAQCPNFYISLSWNIIIFWHIFFKHFHVLR